MRAYLLRVDREWTFALTVGAVANPDLLGGILIERAQHSPTFATIELDIFQLREDPGAPCHNTGDPDEVVEVGTAEISE